MGLISVSIPQVGLSNTTEDPKVASDITTIANVINGNLDLTNLSAALQAIVPGTWTAYTPTWACAGTAPSLGNGALAGSYQIFNKTCIVRIVLVAGSTTGGGTQGMTFSLPLPAVAGYEQEITAKFFQGANGWVMSGVGSITAGSSTLVPYFPLTSSSAVLGQLQNTDNTANPGTGIPLVGGSYPIVSGSNVIIQGAYQTA